MSLTELILKARNVLLVHPEGALTLDIRKEIWRALANYAESEEDAYFRRVRLSSLSVRHVLPVWNKSFSDDQAVQTMLDIADQVAAGAIDEDTAQVLRDRFYVDIVDNRKYGSNPAAMFVGHAAANTIIEAMIRDTESAIPNVNDDEDLDPESYDPSYMCSCAASGNLLGKQSDEESRRKFWIWYLDYAILAAYDLKI